MPRDASADLLRRFAALNVWKRGGERAPHKPLLVLYTLGRWSRGQKTPVPYADVDRDLGALLREFGPPRQSFHPEYPFWRLQRDGLWEVTAKGPLEARKGHTDAKKSELLKKEADGQFTREIRQALDRDPKLLAAVAQQLLDGHFPTTLHEDILSAVGLELEETVAPAVPRSPRFRELILRAYRHECAVCGFGLTLGQNTVAVEAAHIKWHNLGGPDAADNGLALCSTHHKLLDHGAFTIHPVELSLLVSDLARGPALEESLLRHHGRPIRRPQREGQRPSPIHVRWHHRQVFKGEALEVA